MNLKSKRIQTEEEHPSNDNSNESQGNPDTIIDDEFRDPNKDDGRQRKLNIE